MEKENGDNPIGNAYGVTATPTYFVLDKNKNIIDKPYEFKNLMEFVDKQKMPKKEASKKEMSKVDKSN